MKKPFVLLILSGFFFSAGAQFTDTQLWMGPVIKYNINNIFRIDFEQQFRFKENISKFDFTYSEFGFRYKVFKYLDIKAIYRHSYISSGQTGSAIAEYDKSRIALNASTGAELFNTGIKVGYRIMFQHSWENTTLIASDYLRNRIELDYNMSKLVDPYARYESYYRFNDKNEFRQNRTTFGLTWKISDKLDIDSFFRYQNEINVKNPETDFIIGLGVVYLIN